MFFFFGGGCDLTPPLTARQIRKEDAQLDGLDSLRSRMRYLHSSRTHIFLYLYNYIVYVWALHVQYCALLHVCALLWLKNHYTWISFQKLRWYCAKVIANWVPATSREHNEVWQIRLQLIYIYIYVKIQLHLLKWIIICAVSIHFPTFSFSDSFAQVLKAFRVPLEISENWSHNKFQISFLGDSCAFFKA